MSSSDASQKKSHSQEGALFEALQQITGQSDTAKSGDKIPKRKGRKEKLDVLFLTCPLVIPSAASAQERSLTERQKHRSQDAPRPLPAPLKGPAAERRAPSGPLITSQPDLRLPPRIRVLSRACIQGNPNPFIHLK
ncbi:uncharacterized protein V6R79_009493 [Siganus canaliculatus]